MHGEGEGGASNIKEQKGERKQTRVLGREVSRVWREIP